MMDKSQLIDVIKHIMNKKKVVALYAPSIASQFRATSSQLENAFYKLGFSDVYEVALGADICAEKEAKEFTERMKRGDKLMTTSCCSAYVRAVHIHVPELDPCVSETKSPMHYTAEIAKQEHPDCITVFIGPCLAKRREGFGDDLVDYVLSAEEIDAFLIAKDIDLSLLDKNSGKAKPSATGRNFAKSGGVAEAVKSRLTDPSILKLDVIDGLDKNGMKKLKMYGDINSGKIKKNEDCANLIEVMACEGGCIAGPCTITSTNIASVFLKKYVQEIEDK